MPFICSMVQETQNDVDTDVHLDSEEEETREAGIQTLRCIFL